MNFCNTCLNEVKYPKVYCEDCRKERKRDAANKYARRVRNSKKVRGANKELPPIDPKWLSR